MKASENLDLDKVVGSFAEDATMFFPMTEAPQRFDGKEAIRAHYLKVFESIRRRSASAAPPHQQLVPEDITWHAAGPDAAIVSFHIRGGQDLARRTVVLARRDGTWLVVHLHASNLPVSPNN
jgi:ketosteroid isomerase-like protein